MRLRGRDNFSFISTLLNSDFTTSGRADRFKHMCTRTIDTNDGGGAPGREIDNLRRRDAYARTRCGVGDTLQRVLSPITDYALLHGARFGNAEA